MTSGTDVGASFDATAYVGSNYRQAAPWEVCNDVEQVLVCTFGSGGAATRCGDDEYGPGVRGSPDRELLHSGDTGGASGARGGVLRTRAS